MYTQYVHDLTYYLLFGFYNLFSFFGDETRSELLIGDISDSAHINRRLTNNIREKHLVFYKCLKAIKYAIIITFPIRK